MNKDTPKTLAQKLGIFIRPDVVNKVLASVNIETIKKSAENEQALQKIKKEDAPVEPKFTEKPPVKPQVEDEHYKNARREFDEKHEAFLKLRREYEKYASDRYMRAVTTFQAYKKIQEMVELKKSPTEAKNKKFEALKISLLNEGLRRPVFREEIKNGKPTQVLSGQVVVKKYTEVVPNLSALDWSEESLQSTLVRIQLDNKEVMELLETKHELRASELKFGTSVTMATAWFLQVAVGDLMRLALADCKPKKTLKIENFRNEVISSSPYMSLFQNLPVLNAVNAYTNRLNDYNIKLAKLRTNKEFKNFSVSTFVESEQRTKNMKLLTNKQIFHGAKSAEPSEKKEKFWPGLSLGDGNINFCTYLTKVFDKVCLDTKNSSSKISTRVKEMLSLLCEQFLQTMVRRFEISKTQHTINEKGKIQKSITFGNVIFIFGILLVPDDKDDKDVRNSTMRFAKSIKDVIREHKKPKTTN